MDPIKREHDVEQWLDSALSQYGKAEPRTGLESRVLASLQAERNRRTSCKRWWWAMGAVAAAMAIVAVVWVGENGRKKNAGGMAETSTPTRRKEAQRSIKLGPAPPAVHPAREVAQRRPAHQPSREPAVAPTPKLDHFPSRRKMSDAEFLLARRLNEQSNKKAFLESTPGSEAVDLSIGSLEISPLQIPDIEISESKTN